jgi:hypothetical protein
VDHNGYRAHKFCLYFFRLVLCSYGAERFEDGASQINKSDMFFGDDGSLTEAQLKHMDEVTMKNVKFVKMTEGVFDGTRKHAVAWFGGWEGEEEMKQSKTKTQQQPEKALAAPFFVKA